MSDLERWDGAIWRPLVGDEANQPNRRPIGFIVHTFVDHPGPTDMAAYFDRDGIKAESTFVGPRFGTAIQIMPTTKRVDTQVAGNLWYHDGEPVGYASVEMEDDGDPEGIPFTDDQLDQLVGMFVYMNDIHGVPFKWCASPTSPGFGYHSMWGFVDNVNLRDGYLQNPWTTSRGKTCPGRTRIAQLRNIVMPRAIEAAQLQKDTEPMTPADLKTLGAYFDAAHIERESLRADIARVNAKVDAAVAGQKGRTKLLRRILDRLKAGG